MFDSLSNLLSQFQKGKSSHIFFATLLGRLVNFIVNLAIIHILVPEDYGNISYALMIVNFILPLIGGGILPSFVRYGSTAGSFTNRNTFVWFATKIGIFVSALIVLLFWLLIPFMSQQLKGASLYLFVLSFHMFGFMFLRAASNYALLVHNNKLYAYIETIFALSSLIFNILFAYLFGGIGYVISVVSLPFIIGIYFIIKLKIRPAKEKVDYGVSFKTLLSYGFFTSLGGAMAQLLYAVDIVLIGNILMDEVAIAHYRTASIIPLNLIILSSAIMSSMIVKLTQALDNNPYFIVSFYKNYLKIFIPISILIFIIFYFGSPYIMKIFGNQYEDQSHLMFLFSIGVIGSLLFRTPLANLLPTLGFPKLSAFFSFLILMLNIGGSYMALQKYGIQGAVIVTSSLFWISGFLNLGLFLCWKIKNNIYVK